MKKSLFTDVAKFSMAKSFLCTVIMFSIGSSFAQAPLIEWQKSFGGSSPDAPNSVKQTVDGGYIVAGYSESTDGDVTSNHGDEDCWIVKLDGSGNIQWQKTLGGSGLERAESIQQTDDGGYIVAGYSESSDGDVTGYQGARDYWVVKLGNSGNIQWQKTLGGSYTDGAYYIQQANDGGYIVTGFSSSYDGDVTGHHGGGDFWVVKLDGSGNIQWQKTLGGSGFDHARSIQQTVDGGYIVAGLSESNDGDVIGNHGSWDYWIVKLDGSGNIQWQKTLGGSNIDEAYSIQQTTDGGYIVAGYSNSNDGDVTGNHGNADYWVVKLDGSGDVIWQKTFGGSSDDFANSIQQTTDGGYIVAGDSGSNDGDVTGNHGFHDYWVVKLYPSGNIQWQKTFGGGGSDLANSIQQTSDGGYIVAGYSRSNDGDVTSNHGNWDYWIVKLADMETGTESIAFPGNIAVYPNPAIQELTIDLTGSEFSSAGTVVTLFDLQGRKVYEKTIINLVSIVNVEHLEKGMYFLKVENNDRHAISRLVIN